MQATFQMEPWQIAAMIRESAPAYGRELARQEALSKTYKVNSELSERMQLSDATIYKLLNSGELLGKRVGETWRVSEWAIRKYFGEDLSGNDYREEEEQLRATG